MKSPTIVDVAHAAGVGVGTVSRVMNGNSRVAPETRERVRAAAERLGYRPNPIARAFSRRRTHILEVVIPLLTRYFSFEVLRGIELGLADTDYTLVIRTVERAAERDQVFQACCPRGRADGVLIVSLAPPPELLDRLGRAGIPIVLVDRESDQFPSVAVDHEAAATMAVRHLIELGHRRIALIDRAQDPFSPEEPSPRQRGYRVALSQAGLVWPAEYERVTEFSPEASAAMLEALLQLPDPPTAVFVGSDTQAIGVLDTARRHGRRIPEDFGVVGYNDIELAQYLGLTTVRVPMREMGKQGVELLLAEIERPSPAPRSIRLPTELVIRQTCGPFRGPE